MTKTHLIALIGVLLFSAQAKAGDSSPNSSNLATIFDPNVISCNVDKTRTLPYVARVELKVSETASRQYVFFENGEGIVTLEDGTTALLSLKETAAFFGYSEDDFKRDPVLHIRTTAESWTGIIGLFNITAAIDPGLLDLIDQKASLYFNPSWNLNINQFKAWLATIAWAEGGLGGYGAHSQYGGGYNGDAFNHIVVGGSFRFSTGIGPFQLDRGSSENWGLLRTGQKLDPQLAVESAARWHRDNRGSGSTLSNFANNSPWVGVRTPDAYWSVVTGTAWSAHSGGNASLDWSGIRNQLGANAAGYPYLSYSNNVVDRGYLTWNIKSGANLLTESGRPVIFDGNYQTWLVTARPWGGQPEVCKYYYTYRTDGTYPIEVWVWDNNWDTNNKFKYIFARECNGQFPEWRSGSSAGYPALSQPAIIIGGQSDLTIVEPVVVSPASVAPGGTIRVDWTEKNQGTAASTPAHNTKIFLSASAYGTTYQVGYYGPMYTLGPGATQSYYANIVVPTSIPSGNYYVTVYIDCDSQVSEGNENNNIGSSSPIMVTVTSPPPNDMFANATTISGSSGQTTGSNVGATKEAGEPSHAGNAGGASVWWRWTAPFSGQATINTNGSSFDTLLGVYTGSSVGSLTLVASDDDGGDGTQSLVTFNAVSGTTYRIAVDGYGGVTGNITLNWSLIQQTGNLQVTLGPSGAVSAGAQWNVDGGGWQNSGATVTGLSVGSHTVNYKSITGWNAPSSESVTINNGLTTSISRNYTQQTGNLQVTLGPSGAVSAGAQWNVDSGGWQNSGATVTGLSVGSHTVNYNSVTGWSAPPSEQVNINSGQTTQITSNYEQISLRPMTVDLNHDGLPNFYDFSIFAMFWQNASCSEPNWCEGSDFDKNGIVDIYDLQIFAEFWLWPVADVDMDGAVNFTDYAIFAHNWMDDTCCDPNWCEGTDFDHSGSVDMLDLATFARYWLEGTSP